MPKVREMIRARRNEDVRWEISDDSGRVVGWVVQHRIGRASRWFYRAVGIDPEGNRVDLENSGDREERIALVLAFSRDPDPWRGIHWHPERGGRS